MHRHILLLALEWELFEHVHLLAISMSSEDHTVQSPPNFNHIATLIHYVGCTASVTRYGEPG